MATSSHILAITMLSMIFALVLAAPSGRSLHSHTHQDLAESQNDPGMHQLLVSLRQLYAHATQVSKMMVLYERLLHQQQSARLQREQEPQKQHHKQREQKPKKQHHKKRHQKSAQKARRISRRLHKTPKRTYRHNFVG